MSADRCLGPCPADRNPFSTSATRPGALAFRFPAGCQAPDLIARLRANGWWGEVIGPHGSGKSTLVQTLLPLLRDAGRSLHPFTLHRGGTLFSQGDLTAIPWSDATQIVVDGFEQLRWRDRSLLRRDCRHHGAGLLVTTHRSVGLPHLFSTSTSLELAEELVGRLLPTGLAAPVAADDVASSFRRHEGNLREVLFELYDLYESRRPR